MRVVTTLAIAKSYMSEKQAERFEKSLPLWVNSSSMLTVHWMLKVLKPVPKVIAQLEVTEPKRWLALMISKGYMGIYLQIRSEQHEPFEDCVVVQRVPREIVEYVEQKRAPGWEGEHIKIYTPMHQKHPGVSDYALLGCIDYKEQLCVLVSDQKSPLQSIGWNLFAINPIKRTCWSLGLSMDRQWFDDFQKAQVGEDVFVAQGMVAMKKEADFLKKLPKSVVFQWVFTPWDEANKLPKSVQKFRLGECLPG